MLAPSWTAVLLSIGISQAVFFAQSIYLHRCLAHRSLALHPSVRIIFRIIIWLFFGSDPREWVATHRLHHRYADTEKDPHSPLVAGFWTVVLLGSRLVREACRDRERLAKLTADMPPDIFARLPIGRRYGGILVSILAMCVAVGPVTAAWTYFLAVTQILAGIAVVNVFGHLPGPAISGHIGRNLPVFAPLTAGEALHGNHHAAPSRTYLAWKRRELDPGWWLIVVMTKLGLAAPKVTRMSYRGGMPKQLADLTD